MSRAKHRWGALALALSIPWAAHAEPNAPDPRPPAAEQAHTERVAGLTLSALSVGLAALGGALGGARDAVGDGGWRAGVGIGAIGGALLLPALELDVYAAGHRAGLRFRPEAADPAKRALEWDAAEAAARQQEIAGIVTLSVGAALAAAGAALAVSNLHIRFADDAADEPPSTGAFAAGMLLGLLGDASFLTGMFLWPYAAARRRGLRESRAALALTPTGLVGRF